MDISNLKENHTYKNYKELCSVLNVPILAGNSKKAQLKEFERYFKYEKEGHKFIINHIYNVPLPKIDKRKLSKHRKYKSILETDPSILEYIHKSKNKDINLKILTKNSRKKLWFVCKQCNESFYKEIDITVARKYKCDNCTGSRGERKIRSILKQLNIKYKEQYTFKNLRGIHNKPLRFDFAIFDDKNNLKLLIEYDGIFHYEIVNDDIVGYKTIKEHDKRKNTYCKEKNIKLLRIPYTKFNKLSIILCDAIEIKNPYILLKILSKKQIIDFYEMKLRNFTQIN